MYKQVLKSIVVTGGMILNNFQGKVERGSKDSDLDDQYVQASSIAHTELDDLIQEIALEILYNSFPDLRLNVEENTPRIDLFDNESELTFHLDPLDGTYAFTENRSDFAIGAGISKGTKFIESMVFLPRKDRLYYATEQDFEVMNARGETLNFERTSPIANTYVQKRCEEYLPQLDQMGLEKLDSMSAHNTMMELVEGHASLSLYHQAAPHDFGIPKLILESRGGICTDEHGDPVEFNENFDRVDYFFAFANHEIKDLFFDLL